MDLFSHPIQFSDIDSSG